jgi:hypothetical protein
LIGLGTCIADKLLEKVHLVSDTQLQLLQRLIRNPDYTVTIPFFDNDFSQVAFSRVLYIDSDTASCSILVHGGRFTDLDNHQA